MSMFTHNSRAERRRGSYGRPVLGPVLGCPLCGRIVAFDFTFAVLCYANLKEHSVLIPWERQRRTSTGMCAGRQIVYCIGRDVPKVPTESESNGTPAFQGFDLDIIRQIVNGKDSVFANTLPREKP